MNATEIQALLNESACSHKARENSGDSRLNPDATAGGGCSFDWAQIALLSLADVTPIVHDSIACASRSWDNRSTCRSGPTRYGYGMTVTLTGKDAVMGLGKKSLADEDWQE